MIWQKYPIELKIKPEIIFPDASKTTLNLVQEFKKDNNNIINWLAYNELIEKNNYKFYPFDIKKIEISLEYPKTHGNVMLVPDLEAYYTLSNELKMGLGNISKINGYNIKQSYFEYKIAQTTNYVDQVKPILSFNVLLQRSLLNPFFIYFMPLFLILIALFAVIYAFERALQLSDRIKFQALSIITALLFSLVLLHRYLRTDFQTQGIMYLEYLFFSIYVIMSLLVLYMCL